MADSETLRSFNLSQISIIKILEIISTLIFLFKKLAPVFFVVVVGHIAWLAEFSFPNQGSILCSPQWK